MLISYKEKLIKLTYLFRFKIYMMKQFTSISETINYLNTEREKGMIIGFVPTMGALHDGHLSLVNRSKMENDLTVCSIFVNPAQFNNREDLNKYPRTLVYDAKLLTEIGCDVLFAPEASAMYPEGETPGIDVDFGMLDKVMEGKFRPGHFEGVAIVVKKLFDIVYPARAYFGKKDYQQLAVIRRVVRDLDIPVAVLGAATLREIARHPNEDRVWEREGRAPRMSTYSFTLHTCAPEARHT